MSDKNNHCRALALVNEFEGIARKRGVIALNLYPLLKPILASLATVAAAPSKT
jgi:hypothetical protein